MGRFTLHFEDETKPLRRGKTVVASATFLARVLTDVLLVASLIYLGWMYAMGDTSPLHGLASMV